MLHCTEPPEHTDASHVVVHCKHTGTRYLFKSEDMHTCYIPICFLELYFECCLAIVVFCLQGDSHTIRGYGNTGARDWYAELPDAVRRIVD